MRLTLETFFFAVAVTGAWVCPTSAQAKSQLSLSGQLGAVSDYRFRGVSLSGVEPALQAGVTLEHTSGLYVGTWASTIAETTGGAKAEVDWLAGYATTVTSKVNLELAVSYYSYPSDGSANYLESTATFSYSLGRFTPKLGASYAPKQSNMRDESGRKRDNFYSFAGLDVEVPGAPVVFKAQLGHEQGLFDLVENGGKWDWQVGGTARLKGFDVGLAYVDSNARNRVDGDNLAGSTVVASALVSW